jgi:hypothetical protein
MLLTHPLDYIILGTASTIIVGLLVMIFKELKQLGEDDDEDAY